MSSRALRRAQKELEERQRLEQLAQQQVEEEAESEDVEEEIVPASNPKASLFAMLGEAGGEEIGDGDEEAVADGPVEPQYNDSEEIETTTTPPKPSKKGKKKKKKGNAKARKHETAPSSTASKLESGMDEIDRALHSLNITSQAKSGAVSDELTTAISEEKQHLFSAIAVDKQHLHASNEMRKLFGRAAVQGADDDEPARARQRRGQQHGGIAAAVAGRTAPGNRNLASLSLRRNIFIQGKEEWPRAPSGGLGMEIVEKRKDGTVEYRFVHSTLYQSTQSEFEVCVASMDPERMIQHLHFNPYHISTLLQVSEIAKQQRDNATASDLLERALFSFGRAVHSTFANNLAQGTARLDFRRPENREFWLAVWRYIGTLGIRATWRTAFEWAKLLLSLDPDGDPYCIRLLIDQLALRGREPQNLVELVESDHLQRIWKIPPNLAFSVAIAYDRLKDRLKARSSLRLAIKEYPWVAARLCKELEIEPIPKPVWGKEPIGDYHELLCQLYVPKAKDLWNTPEATSLLVEVAYSVEEVGAGEDPYWLASINELDLARHVILSEDRSLLSLLDPRVKAHYTSTSDPLPPEDNKQSYTPTRSRSRNVNEEQLLTELESLREYFTRVDLHGHIDHLNELTEEAFHRLLEENGTTFEEFRRNTERVQTMRDRLARLGPRAGFDDGEANGRDRDDQESDA
ncbi:DUF654-domain-containing protein [Lojkania enalia]|uniref:DUF654-domain-containing protein n=1 Tax=Lojkania enalia TaxID=147567 RepID=A0A9P4JXI7_9PLEO|nr:DUF654-domain-containing protein [Didymosphaeria enalia]